MSAHLDLCHLEALSRISFWLFLGFIEKEKETGVSFSCSCSVGNDPVFVGHVRETKEDLSIQTHSLWTFGLNNLLVAKL